MFEDHIKEKLSDAILSIWGEHCSVYELPILIELITSNQDEEELKRNINNIIMFLKLSKNQELEELRNREKAIILDKIAVIDLEIENIKTTEEEYLKEIDSVVEELQKIKISFIKESRPRLHSLFSQSESIKDKLINFLLRKNIIKEGLLRYYFITKVSKEELITFIKNDSVEKISELEKIKEHYKNMLLTFKEFSELT